MIAGDRVLPLFACCSARRRARRESWARTAPHRERDRLADHGRESELGNQARSQRAFAEPSVVPHHDERTARSSSSRAPGIIVDGVNLGDGVSVTGVERDASR